MARLVVLTPNPAIDVTYRVAHQKIGDTVRVLEVFRRPGGKGVNAARVMRALGHDVVCLLPLGGSAGDWIGDALATEGIPVRSIKITHETRSTVTIVDGIQHPTMIAEPGPSLSTAELRAVRSLVTRECESADALVVAGSLTPGMTPSDLGEWVVDARQTGVRTLVDAGGPAVLAAAGAGADLVKPNAAELREATGHSDIDLGIRQLLEAGARSVVVSAGSDGVTGSDSTRLADGSAPIHVPAVPGVTGNPTGAGDATTAALAIALLDRLPLEVALGRASALGAAAVLRPLAGDVDLDAYADFLTRHFHDGAPIR